MDDTSDAAYEAAFTLLEIYTATGATRFDFTITDRQGQKVRFRRNATMTELRHTLPVILDTATRQQHNVIIRPHGPGTEFIQLDDLTAADTLCVKPVAFVALETSPGNFQAWIAIPRDEAAPDFARRLRKGAGADPSASGATRIAGSLNFKDKYAPDFPRVQITHSSPGLTVTPAQLEALGIVAAPEPARKPSAVRVSPPRTDRRKWPSYERCLQNAPPNHDNTGPDTSKADFVWCMTAHDWGWSSEDIAARLMELSSKAKENGERYATLTTSKAIAAVSRRQKGRG